MYNLQKSGKKGFPDCSNFRFITLTVDNKKYFNAKEAYEKTKGQVRRFLCALRKKYGHFIWFKKLEFTKNDFPHWHLIVGIKHKIDLDFVNKAWGRGRTNVERIEAKGSLASLDYLCKYVSKGGDLPSWVLDYDNKMRFSEHSNDFFVDNKEASSKTKSIKIQDCNNSSKKKPFKTIREKLNSWDNSLLLSVKDNDSEMFYRIPLNLKHGFKELENIIGESAKKYFFL